MPPKATGTESSAARHLRQLQERDRRKPLTITVTYRGGPECWWELRARGVTIRRPGVLALHDVLSLFDGTLRK